MAIKKNILPDIGVTIKKNILPDIWVAIKKKILPDIGVARKSFPTSADSLFSNRLDK